MRTGTPSDRPQRRAALYDAWWALFETRRIVGDQASEGLSGRSVGSGGGL